MIGKNWGVFAGSLFLIILFLGFASAVPDSCTIQNTPCTNGVDYRIMSLSSDANAHGEIWNGAGNYGWNLCCNFPGTRECIGTNKIVGLSASTNAHAEIPTETTYTENVCYGYLDCVSSSGTCSAGYNIEMLSLSDTTNAHLAQFSEALYTTKVCCKQASNFAYWTDKDRNYVVSPPDVISVRPEFTNVLLNLRRGPIEEAVTFEIYEDDTFPNPNDNIRTRNDALTGTTDSNGDVIVSWTITQDDLDKTKNDYEQFYFEVYDSSDTQIGKSGDLTLTTLPSDFCQGKNLCSDYTTSDDCSNDDCNFGGKIEQYVPETVCEDGPSDCDAGWTKCSCSWDSLKSKCGPSKKEKYNDCSGSGYPLIIGACNYEETKTSTCDAGGSFLTFDLTPTWSWDLNNIFTSGSKSIPPYMNDPLPPPGDGNEHYDSEGKAAGCRASGGAKVFQCPGEIKLPFFTFTNMIIAVILIILVYVIINKSKTKGKKTRKKKR